MSRKISDEDSHRKSAYVLENVKKYGPGYSKRYLQDKEYDPQIPKPSNSPNCSVETLDGEVIQTGLSYGVAKYWAQKLAKKHKQNYYIFQTDSKAAACGEPIKSELVKYEDLST